MTWNIDVLATACGSMGADCRSTPPSPTHLTNSSIATGSLMACMPRASTSSRTLPSCVCPSSSGSSSFAIRPEMYLDVISPMSSASPAGFKPISSMPTFLLSIFRHEPAWRGLIRRANDTRQARPSWHRGGQCRQLHRCSINHAMRSQSRHGAAAGTRVESFDSHSCRGMNCVLHVATPTFLKRPRWLRRGCTAFVRRGKRTPSAHRRRRPIRTA